MHRGIITPLQSKYHAFSWYVLCLPWQSIPYVMFNVLNSKPLLNTPYVVTLILYIYQMERNFCSTKQMYMLCINLTGIPVTYIGAQWYPYNQMEWFHPDGHCLSQQSFGFLSMQVGQSGVQCHIKLTDMEDFPCQMLWMRVNVPVRLLVIEV